MPSNQTHPRSSKRSRSAEVHNLSEKVGFNFEFDDPFVQFYLSCFASLTVRLTNFRS